MTKNVRIMLALLTIALLYTFVLGCDDTGEPVVISTEGEIEDWEVTGLDSAIEEMAKPALDFGDAVIDTAKDTLEDAVEWGFDTTGGQ